MYAGGWRKNDDEYKKNGTNYLRLCGVGDCGTDFLPNFKWGREFGIPAAPSFLSLKEKGDASSGNF